MAEAGLIPGVLVLKPVLFPLTNKSKEKKVPVLKLLVIK